MKVRIIIYIIIILFLAGCKNIVIVDELPKDSYINIKNEEIDVYSDTKLSDLIETNIDFYEDIVIDTDSLGKKTYDFRFKNDNKDYLYHINYEVKDLSKPRILSGGDRYVTVNSDVYLCDYIMYGDEYDNEAVCRVEGEYDLNKIGIYNIKYIVTDSSNNEETFETKLHVYKPSDDSNNETKVTHTYFSEIVDNYKSHDTKIGLDISSWQGDVDFNKLKSNGVEFIIIRIGLQLSESRRIEIDNKYKEYIKSAKNAGLDVGVYFYSIALTKEEAIKHAKWVLKELDGETLELGVYFDWESFSKWNSYKLSFHDINEIANSFIKTINDSGYKGYLYSSKFYLENIWETKQPVWLAHYTKKTSYEGNYNLWQMCNDGVIDGISGPVDIDIMYLK